MDSIELVNKRLNNKEIKEPIMKMYETKIIEQETVCEYKNLKDR